MAIIQISKIQQRSGNLVDLPQLDEAQFGFAQDASRLFIGKTTGTPENIEVLTSYSEISFSQVQGSGGSNVNITANTLQPGQILGYDSVTGSWVNTGGNTANAGNANAYTGIPVHLGSVSNVKIGDGAIGYVLTTDGYGNLNWSPKTNVVANIIDISDADPAVMTFNPTIVSYTNGTAITILGIAGNSSANANLLNGNTFYVKVANDFNTTGDVSLYISDALDAPNAYNGAGIVYDNPANVFATATSSFGTGGSTPAAGAEGSIQYNVSGVLTGSALLKFANSNVEISTSNVVVTGGNVSANVISGNVLTGTLSTNAQPNITSIGTLSSLSVSGNATVGNINGGNLVTANYFEGTLTSNTQSNITSTGTLSSLSVSGNATVGNINGGNLVTANNITITGISDLGSNANVRITGGNPIDVLVTIDGAGNLAWGTLTLDAEIANGLSNVYVNFDGNVTTSVGGVANVLVVTGTGANVNGTLSVSGNTDVLGIKTDNYYYANGVAISFAGSYNDTNVSTFLASYGSNTITTTGNVDVGNISATLVTGTLATASQPNITSTGTLSGLTVAGNIVPSADILYDLGNTTNRWHDLYLSGNTIYIGTSTITANTTGVTINTPNASPVALKPAGANTQVQYNDDGAFGGQNTFTFNELTSTLTANNFVATSTANLGAVGNLTITGGSNGQVLTTNGSNVLSWTTVTSGNGSSYGDSNVVTLLASYGSNSISTTGNVTAGNITAQYLLNSVQTGITANGSNAGTATELGNTINIVSTVSSGTGVKLPNALPGMTVYVTNISNANLIVYPASGAIFNPVTGNANITQPANSTIHYIASSTTQWYPVGAVYA
jgi:hypothetical protein